MAGVVEPVLGVDELSPDLSCGVLSSPKSPPLAVVEALLLKRLDPEVLVGAPKRLLEGGATDAAELDSTGLVGPKIPPDEG